MGESAATLAGRNRPAQPGGPSRLDIALGRLAGRLGDGLAGELGYEPEGGRADSRADPTEPADPAVAFLRAFAASTGALLRGPVDGGCLDLPSGAAEPVDRLVAALALTDTDIDLLLLALLPHQHEGLAAILRSLHPDGRPWPTVGLAAVVVGDRKLVRQAVLGGALAAAGGLVVEGDGPWPERSIRGAPGLWEALAGDVPCFWPAGWRPDDRPAPVWGLAAWLEEDPVRAAITAVAGGEPVVIAATGDRPGALAARLAVIVEAAGRRPGLLSAPVLDDGAVRTALLVGLARGVTPVMWSDRAVDGALTGSGLPGPILVAAPEGVIEAWPRPVVRVPTPPLSRPARIDALAAAVPPLAPFAHPIGPACLEPTDLAVAVADVAATAGLGGSRFTAAALAEAVDRRAAAAVPAGAVLVHPGASFADLVLPSDRQEQLREAVARVGTEATVLDQWGFLSGRRGRRGLRLLFSGPPGTGKTLAAEVLAGALGRDLLVVDLSRIVSKWIGETEKNLAGAFEAAERGGAVLFFDEADALFGRRTEVGDARDRYANLETAYLLARLEACDGVVVLATNLRQNLDAAFSRRLEYMIAFDPPDAGQREILWRRHLPARAPVSPSVDPARLGALYEVPGALIRNAAVAAAHLAAGDPGGPVPISMGHIVRALRREYQKAGQSFPGAPVGTSR